jgi:hypothetical protein
MGQMQKNSWKIRYKYISKFHWLFFCFFSKGDQKWDTFYFNEIIHVWENILYWEIKFENMDYQAGGLQKIGHIWKNYKTRGWTWWKDWKFLMKQNYFLFFSKTTPYFYNFLIFVLVLTYFLKLISQYKTFSLFSTFFCICSIFDSHPSGHLFFQIIIQIIKLFFQFIRQRTSKMAPSQIFKKH